MKAVEAVEAVPSQIMAVVFSRTFGRFGLRGGPLVDRYHSDCSMSRLTGSAVLRMRLGT